MKMRKFLAQAITGIVVLSATSAFADGDAVKGEKVFKKCQSCHTINKGDKHKVGPNLFGVVGSKGASSEGYKYSKGYLNAAPNLTWNEADLMEYLLDPSAYLSAKAGKDVKSKMTFKLKKEDARADVIAYLNTMK